MNPGGLNGFVFTPFEATVTGGETTSGLLQLSGPAPAGGIVAVLSTNSGSITLVPSISFAQGETSKSVQVQTGPVSVQAMRTITATWASVTRNQTITLNPIDLFLSFTLNPSTVKGGQTSSATVTLKNPAPVGGITLVIGEDDPLNIVSKPTSAFIAAGATTTTFTVTTGPTGVPGYANILIKAGQQKSAVLIINP